MFRSLARLISAPRLAAVLLAVGGLFIWQTLQASPAQAATLRFNPTTLKVGLSETAELQLIASSTDKPIYSLEITVSYPTNLILGIEANAKGTNFPLTVFPSTVDNTQGRAKFTVAAQKPGYIGNNGVVGTLLFRGQKLGTGQITVVSAKIIHVDQATDQESNVYTSSTPAQLIVDNAVSPQYTTPGVRGPVPIVSSPSHPDPSKWYQERAVQFTWTGGNGGYSWVFDQNPETLAPAVSKGTGTSTTIGGVGDGTWYMHVRAESSGVWGPTTTFRVQVDGSPPGNFQLQVDPDNTTNPSALPKISFEATDTHGGIDYYEVSLDGSDPVKTRSPYQLPQLKPGQHTVVVWAIDKAGNRTRAETTLNLIPLSPKPVITNPDSGATITMGGEDGSIRGTGPAGSTMQLFADGKYIMSVEVDDQGKFEFKLDGQLDPGEYDFTVRAVKPNHLESEASEVVRLKVLGGGLIGGFGQDLSFGNFKVPFWVTIILYILILLLLIFLLIYLYYRWRKARREQKLAMQKLELMTAPDPASSPIPTDVGQQATAATTAIPPVPSSNESPPHSTNTSNSS